jgi:CRP/FNR family transcriptional regulator, cyclic AMP receptor protein
MASLASQAGAVAGSFVALLDQTEREAMYDLGIQRAFPRGSLLMFEQEPGERVMILLAGRVKISRVGEDGREVLLGIRDPGDVLGELAFIDGHPRIASATALEEVEAVVMPASTFRAHLERTPRVAVALLEVVTRRVRDATVKLSQAGSSDVIGRLAARIVELAERYGDATDDGVVVALPLSQEELAAWTGASRAGVAHALQTLRTLGWVQTARRSVIVRDLDALKSRAA